MRTIEEVLEEIRTTHPMSVNMGKLIKELKTILNKQHENIH
jgi:hypothetical protein